MLSNRKLKAFDRQGGAYLALPWPADLRRPSDIAPDDERRASQREHLAAIPLAAPIVRRYGLVHLGTMAGMLRVPHSDPVRHDLYLLVHMVTPRWQGVTTPCAMAPAVWPSECRVSEPHEIPCGGAARMGSKAGPR